MPPRTFLAVVLGAFIATPILAEEVWPHPDQVESRSLGRWTLIRKKYCSLGGCGRTSPPYAVDFLIFAGDTIRGRGFQNISTPFGWHVWESLYPCDCGNRRWLSLDEPYSMPIQTVEDALIQCQMSLPRLKYVKYEKLAYHPSDSLTIWPWELRKSGDGWSVLYKQKPIDPRKQDVDTPWGLMRWDKERKTWICDKPVVPNDFR